MRAGSTASARERKRSPERSGGNAQVRFAKRTKQSNRRSHFKALITGAAPKFGE